MYLERDVNETPVAPAVAEVISVEKGRKNLFGRADLADAYRRALDLIVKHGIFRMVKVSEGDDGSKSVVICNLWRIDRFPGGNVKTLEFLLIEERWVEVQTLDYWPDVPFFPIQKTQSLDWWREVATRAIWKTLMAVGYQSLPIHLSGDDGLGRSCPGQWKPDMAPSKMAYILIGRYLGKSVGYTKKGKPKWANGFLNPSLTAPTKKPHISANTKFVSA